MTTPEADPADLSEQHATATRDEPTSTEPTVPLEAPEADVLEQSADAAPGQHRAERELPLEADDLDAAEQAVVVEQDADEYR
jgi:hypothetical protein